MQATSTTNHPIEAVEVSTEDGSIFIDLREAGRIAGGRDHRWVEAHVLAHRAFGAPPIIELRTTPTSKRCAKVVERVPWIDWIRSREQPDRVASISTGAAPVLLPVGLQSPGKRRAWAKQQGN